MKDTGLSFQTLPSYIRQLFVPTPGYTYVQFDLSQVEARIVSCLVPYNTTLYDAFASGQDIHSVVAGKIFKIDPTTLNKSSPERQVGKKLVHGSNYGLEAYHFSKMAGLGVKDARNILDGYLEMFGIRLWWRDVVARLNQSNMLTTAYGCRQTFYGTWKAEPTDHELQSEKVLNEAYAFEPQSTAVELLNRAMLRIKGRVPDCVPLIQLHDEWVVEVPKVQEEKFISITKEEVSRPLIVRDRQLIVPCTIKSVLRWE